MQSCPESKIMSKVYPCLVLLLFLASCCLSQRVIQLQTLTGDEEDAGLNVGSINIQLINDQESSCYIGDLANQGNTFARGMIDVFEGHTELMDCDGFQMSNNSVTLVVGHTGVDGWLPEWFRYNQN